MKNALKEKSATFIWLNDRINPFFNWLRDTLITAEEKSEAKRFAETAMEPRAAKDSQVIP